MTACMAYDIDIGVCDHEAFKKHARSCVSQLPAKFWKCHS